MEPLIYALLFGPAVLGILCFAFSEAAWIAADKQRSWWVAGLVIPISGILMTIPFLIGPLPALLSPKNKPRARQYHRPPGSPGAIFMDD